jgi:hypothetical protein
VTTKDSICIRCENLDCFLSAMDTTDGVKSLISRCLYGGKNSGNRKTCSKFKPASEDVIKARLNAFNK